MTKLLPIILSVYFLLWAGYFLHEEHVMALKAETEKCTTQLCMKDCLNKFKIHQGKCACISEGEWKEKK